MGAACFDLILPADATGLYIGARDWHNGRRAWCRIDNLFRDKTTISFGLNDSPPQPHFGRTRLCLQPQRTHRFSVRWHQRAFEVALDGHGVSLARLRDGLPDSCSPLAQLFLWVCVRGARHSMPRVRSLPSPIHLNATISCAICQRAEYLHNRQWGVCPLCCSWICMAHARRDPMRRCPKCPMQMMDYVGGHSQLEFGNSQKSDFLGGSLLASAIWEYVIFVRIREVETVALRNLQEMVTQPSLWLSLPDPFDLELTASAWRFHLNFVEQQARQVTARVDSSIMLGDARKNLQGLSEKHSISDVDRACKRLGAWTRLMMSLIPYKEAVCKDLVMSPVDPSTSKQRWESHLFELRQCVDLLHRTSCQAHAASLSICVPILLQRSGRMIFVAEHPLPASSAACALAAQMRTLAGSSLLSRMSSGIV